MNWRLLSPPMQRALWDAGWPALWPLQDEAITAILGTDGHVLIAGDTASGKTEAAFLPVLSLPAADAGFTVLYVSPLRALLNDQWERLRALGAYAGVSAHLWHSDVARSRKARSEEQPAGILLTTPESIEALCIHRALHLPSFFGGLRFIVLDELHTFLGTGRGAQLHSLLRRIGRYCATPPRRIGLSATVGDREAASAFLGHPCTVCAGAGPKKGLRLHLRYAPDGDVTGDVFALTRGRKALVFCNSRARVESTTHALNRMAGADSAYLPHHGSLHTRERTHAESALRAAAASIVCTSTLELGIDVGAVDLVVQVDCTHSVAALRQRLGRSGRGPGRDRTGQIYATGEAALVEAVAVVELMRRGWVEPPEETGVPYDVLWQQALSEAVERGGLTATDAAAVPAPLLTHMLAEDHLAPAADRLVAGAEGARLVHRPDFCAVFQAEATYEVASGPRVLGRLQPLPLYHPGTPLIFAGRVWTIVRLDHGRRRIEVEPGAAGHPPVFTSQPQRVHGRIRAEMAAVLLSDGGYPYLDPSGARVLTELRQYYRGLGLGPRARPAVLLPGLSELHAFASDRVANTLALILQLESGFAWETTPWGGVAAPVGWAPLEATLARYGAERPEAGALLARLLALVPDRALVLPKFGRHLPCALRYELHAAASLDIEGALRLLAERNPPPDARTFYRLSAPTYGTPQPGVDGT